MAQQIPQWELDQEPLDDEDRAILEEAQRDPNAVTTRTVVSQKLGLFSTCCMILNRIIGTGIFSTPADILRVILAFEKGSPPTIINLNAWVWSGSFSYGNLRATGSPGASLILWGLGGVISFAGLMVYMEFGLSIPRYRTHGQGGEDKAVPRSGGEKNYLEYVYRTPQYLTTCVYGVVFMVLGNTAGNAISFGEHVLRARGYTKDDVESDRSQWCIKGIAVGAITAACLLHGCWRAGGIWVNNCFATVKCLLLVIFIVAGFVYSAGGGLDRSTHNLDLSCSFVNGANGTYGNPCPADIDPISNISGQIYGYSQSLLLIIFAYGGFENANYILSEIDRPKRTYKWASVLALGLSTLLYMLTNIAYFLVVPKVEFREEDTQLAIKYFQKIIPKNDSVKAAVASFVAFSSFGNIIVVTFVASRVKQEIAKEGVLPYSRIIASDMRTPFSYLRKALVGSASGYSKENTPVAALTLHWVFSLILVLSPTTSDAYLFLLLLHSYALHVGVGFFLAVGLLYLHFKPGSDWNRKREFKPFGSWMWALFYAVANAFIICVAWAPPPLEFKKLLLSKIEFFVYPTVAVSLMAFGAIYWIGFAHLYPRYSKRVLDVRRFPIVQGEVQIYEAVFFNWVVPGDLDPGVELNDQDLGKVH